MRFKCIGGGQDCPEWILSSVAEMSRLSAIKLRSLTSTVCSEMQDVATWKSFTFDKPRDTPSAAASNLCRCGVEFIVESSIAGEVAAAVMIEELQQLGLPKEHAAAMARAIDKNRVALNATWRASLPAPSDCHSITDVVGDRQNIVASSDGDGSLDQDQRRLRVNLSHGGKIDMVLSGMQADMLRNDLTRISSMLNTD